MRKIFILLVPSIILYSLYFILSILRNSSIVQFLNGINFLLPHIVTLIYLNWARKNIDNTWIISQSFLALGILILIIDVIGSVFQASFFLGAWSNISLWIYVVPFFIITLIWSADKNARNK